MKFVRIWIKYFEINEKKNRGKRRERRVEGMREKLNIYILTFDSIQRWRKLIRKKSGIYKDEYKSILKENEKKKKELKEVARGRK